MHRAPLLILALFAALPLASCKVATDNTAHGGAAASVTPGNSTLAGELASAERLSMVADSLAQSGLGSVFDGAGSYTLFAPTNAAFAKLGEAQAALQSPEQSAVMAELIRDHVVPGFLTTSDIKTAIAEAEDGSVEMRTMGEGSLTFTITDDQLTVTSPDGSTALIDGSSIVASNGVAIPIDTVLRKIG